MRLFLHSIYSLTMVMNNNNNNNNSNNNNSNNDNDNSMMSTKKLKILCLHGRQQSAAMMSNKIAGARKKLQRVYELDFLDAPFEIEQVGTTTTLCSTTTTTKSATTLSDDQQQSQQQSQQQRQLEWWTSSNHNTNSNSMKEAYEYVIESTKDKNYDAIIGFSQGGLLGTAMVSLGYFPTVRAVVTAGSPYRTEPFGIIKLMEEQQKEEEKEEEEERNNVPKLHFAGETDSMVPIESTKLLCEHGGNGRIIIHEKGHLFPTKAAYVNEMLDFLKLSLESSADNK